MERRLSKLLNRFKVRFAPKDVMQVVVGSAMIAVPTSYSDEAWRLGVELPDSTVLTVVLLSMGFIAIFTYYNYYQRQMEKHWDEYLKRVISTYAISFLIVCLILTLIQKFPWQGNFLIGFKRAAIIAFPASMGGAVADTLK